MGRKLLENNPVEAFTVSFRGAKEVELFKKAKEEAKKADIPLKVLFLSALSRFIDGEISFSKFCDDYTIMKQEKIIFKKREKLPWSSLSNEPFVKEWEKNLRNS
jgi:hypothetical protein